MCLVNGLLKRDKNNSLFRAANYKKTCIKQVLVVGMEEG